jgi:hypothetical protein
MMRSGTTRHYGRGVARMTEAQAAKALAAVLGEPDGGRPDDSAGEANRLDGAPVRPNAASGNAAADLRDPERVDAHRRRGHRGRTRLV